MYTNKDFNFHKMLAAADNYFFIPLYFIFIVTVILGHNVNESNVLYIEKGSTMHSVEILIFNAVLAFNLIFKFGGLYSLFNLGIKYTAFIENDFIISKRNFILAVTRVLTWGFWLSITSLYCISEINPALGIKFDTSFTVEFLGLGTLCYGLFYAVKYFSADSYVWYEKCSYIYKDENTLSSLVDISDIATEEEQALIKNHFTEFVMTARYLYNNDDTLVARYRK